MARTQTTIAVLVAAILVVGALAHCKTDADCPSSYCVNYHGEPPYECHACGDFCCLTDDDCAAKCTSGSYCQRYPGKAYPYWCHSERCNVTAVEA